MRSPLAQFIADHLSDPVWNTLALIELGLFLAWLRQRKRWRAYDEAGHEVVERQRQAAEKARAAPRDC